MGLLETFRTAFESLVSNKLRAALTMLGVIIGVTSVVTLLALGAGVQSYINSQLTGLGTNLLTISPLANVPGARLMSLGEFARRSDELDPRQPVAVICASGGRSQSAAALLGQKGFDTVYNVIGGTYQWMQRGLPLERN